jgi:hypothetical protein
VPAGRATRGAESRGRGKGLCLTPDFRDAPVSCSVRAASSR